jgi:DNA polymerase-3 subunit epsilon
VYYYLDHFIEMLKFVQMMYGSILAGEHHAFIARFGGLSERRPMLADPDGEPAGAIFNRSLFSYPEITDVELAAAELTSIGQPALLGKATTRRSSPAFRRMSR